MGIDGFLCKLPSELSTRICQLVACAPSAHQYSVRIRPPEYRKCSVTTLAALAKTCKRMHEIANPVLYKVDLQEHFAYGMYWAAKHGRTEAFDRFIQYGGLVYVNDNSFSVESVAGLAEFLLDILIPEVIDRFDWWEPAALDEEPHYIFTPLGVAAMHGQDKMVARLLNCGARIDAPSQNMCSCRFATSHVYRPAPRAPRHPQLNPFWTPLHLAACRGHLSTVKLLVSRGADTKQVARLRAPQITLLHAAAFRNQVSVMDYILKEHIVDPDGGGAHETPLHFAVLHMGDLSGVKMLVDAGANLTARHRWDASPFAIACGSGNFEAALFLMDKMMEESGPRRQLREEVASGALFNLVVEPWDCFFDGTGPEHVGLNKVAWEEQQKELLDGILNAASVLQSDPDDPEEVEHT